MESSVPEQLTQALSAGLRVTLDSVLRGPASSLRFAITVDSHDSSGGWNAWVIKTCSQPHEYRFAETPAVIRAMQFTEHHPLLLYRAEAQSELYFTGQPDDLDRLFVDLRAAHERIAADFVPFMTYLNARHMARDDLQNLVASGHGMLAKGPGELIDVYANVLTQHGCSAKILAAPVMSADSHPHANVLELVPAGVVMGVGFEFRHYKSRRKFNDLIEKLRGW